MKTWTRTAAAAAATAAILSTAGLPATAASINGATSLRVPLSGSLLTDAGSLNLTGTVHLVILPGDPYEPTDPYRVQANLVNVRATSPTLSCRATGSQKFEVSGVDAVQTVDYRLEPLDPYVPAPGTCGGVEELNLRYEINFNDDGTITGVDVTPVGEILD